MHKVTRRHFIGTTAGAALALHSQAAKPKLRQPGDRLNLAFIGTGGRGGANLNEFYNLGEQIVALCDVDAKRLAHGAERVKERCPDARRYQDYRELLAKERDLDGVIISTPDHMHAAAAIPAMQLGYHVYVEKPLVRTVWEARRFNEIAKQHRVITQMGNNGNGTNDQRRAIEVLGSGILGTIKEIHISSDRPIWPQALDRPEGNDPIPEHLAWDLWLGISPERPFKAGVYHDFKWRGWFDFGTGAMGDIACHGMSFFWRALDLQEAISAECVKTTPKFNETYQAASTVKLVVKSGKQSSPVTIYWYDGKTKPAPEVCPEAVATWGEIVLGSTLIIGEKGTMTRGAICMKGEERFRGYGQHSASSDIPQTLPRVKGHHWEFAEAIRGGAKTFSDIDHSVPLTEAVLLGCVSQRIPGELLWDHPNMRFTNSDNANQLLKPHIRPGWSI